LNHLDPAPVFLLEQALLLLGFLVPPVLQLALPALSEFLLLAVQEFPELREPVLVARLALLLVVLRAEQLAHLLAALKAQHFGHLPAVWSV
jgi:hypothetical protein